MKSASITLLALGLLTTGCGPGRYLPPYSVVTRGVMPTPAAPAPSVGTLTFHSLEGPSQSLSTFHGKVVVLDVWATWCAPCKESLAATQALVAEAGTTEVELVALSIDDTDAPIAPFLAQNNLNLRVWRDPGARTLKTAANATSAPTTVLLDRSGNVRFVHEGYKPEDRALIAQELATLKKDGAP